MYDIFDYDQYEACRGPAVGTLAAVCLTIQSIQPTLPKVL